MLICDCGWKGIELIPNYEDNTARCPKCNTVFEGIAAWEAKHINKNHYLRDIK